MIKTRLNKDHIVVSAWKWVLRFIIILFSLLPIYAVLIVALTPYSNILEPQFYPKYWEFKNFAEAFSNNAYAIKNSLIYALCAVLGVTIISIPAAYVLARISFKAKTAVMFGLLITQMMSGIIVLPSLYRIFASIGLVGKVPVFIVVLIGLNLALVIWLLYGFFAGIPKEIEEAASIDGCNYFQLLTKIVVPIGAPGIAVGAIFVFINSFNDFIVPLFMLSDKKTYTVTQVLYSSLTDTTISYHLVAATSIIAILPPVVIFLLFQKKIIQGMTSGAVKG